MSGDPCHQSIADHAFRQSVVFEDRHGDTALSSSPASTTLKLCDFELFCIAGFDERSVLAGQSPFESCVDSLRPFI